MRVIIDERERSLYEKCESLIMEQRVPSYVILSKEVLTIGDIIFKTDDGLDVLVIERKTFPDLLSSIKDGRYEEQSYRILNSSGFPPHSVFYLLEGMFSTLNNPLDKKIILSAITSLQFFKGFSVHRTATVTESAEWILYMADKIEREFLKGKVPYYLTDPFLRAFNKKSENNDTATIVENTTTTTTTAANYCTVVKKVKKDNVTPENIGEIILCQIPGISSVTAITIMKKFTSFPNFIIELQKNPDCIDNIVCVSGKNGDEKSRKISKTSLENIRKYLLGQNQSTSNSLSS
jgi:crossover junction endonuclease MUS81